MLKLIEFILALGIIVLIVPQTPTENVVLRKVIETGLFPNYSKAKEFLNFLTWLLIFIFLFLLFLLNINI